ncbi:MAG TPA: hypothetical protein VMK84_10300 [Streptosporangiaceae bacterium]|nr:hypothetical protein [Streptosporangiaceae bacterium]
MTNEFENFNDSDEEWLHELELRATDLENELFDWREAHARELTDSGYGRDAMPRPPGEGRPGMLRAQARRTPPRPARPLDDVPDEALHHVIEDEEPDDELTSVIGTGARPGWPDPGRRRSSAQQRTQALIDRGRRSAGRAKKPKSRKTVLIVAGIAAVITIASVLIFRSSPGWPPSVATVQSQIETACQNPNIASEPAQVNFACGKDTRQILWVFALMTSGDNPQYSEVRTGRQGLEPITPTQGGQVAWSLNLHHPYNPLDPVDSLQVAARAINNIIGGATLTGTNGKPVVQPGLESDPANCVRYTGSPAIVSHAGFPSLCAQPVTSATGQAALVADTYRQWEVGATAASAYDVSVLFSNASNPGNPQVQAILKTLPNVR